jgi:7-carboxy-7-deazaguanine synthase
MIDRPLQVSEIFGPTLQGEGPRAGAHCLFIRMFGCNLECGWCDTAYTWATTETKAAKTLSGKQFDKAIECHEMLPDEVLRRLTDLWPWKHHPTNIVISGGEPLMQQDSLYHVLMPLDQADCPIHIETAGTIAPTMTTSALVSQFVVSPKLANSGNRDTMRFKPDVLKRFNDHNAYFKFVVTRLADFQEVREIAVAVGIPYQRIMIMPEGTSAARQIALGQEIIDETLRLGYGLSLRQHVLIWGNERGR